MNGGRFFCRSLSVPGMGGSGFSSLGPHGHARLLERAAERITRLVVGWAAKCRVEDDLAVPSCRKSFGHTAAGSFGLPVVGFDGRSSTDSDLGTR